MPRLIAIDLGAHAVKVSTYRLQGRKYLFEERHRMGVPQDGTPPGLEARLAALDALLEDHRELAAAGSDTVALALPCEFATFHRLTMPFNDKAQIEKTLPFAIEAEVPFDLEDMVLGWRVIRSGTGLKTDVVAVMIRHEIVSTWIGATAERRMDPAVVYIDGELLGHYGGAAPQPEGEGKPAAVVVLDIGHMHTLVSVVVDGGTVAATRAINVGGFAFTRAIQTALGCSWIEAEERKHGTFVEASEVELPLADDPTDETLESAEAVEATEGDEPKPEKKTGSGYKTLPPPARAAIDGAIGLMLAEIRSTLIKVEDALDLSVEEVRITGGGAKMPELWDYIAGDLGVSVRRCIDPDGEAVPVGFQLSHALAMHAAGQTRSPAIDLRVGDLEYRGGTDLLRAALVYGSSGVAFFTLAAVVMFAIQFRSLVVEQRAADEQIRTIVTETFPEVPPGTVTDGETAVALARGLRDDAVQRAAILSRGGGGIPPTIDTLATLTDAFPDHPTVKVEVEQLTITPTQISFEAETDGYASSARVEEDLQGHPRFGQATKGQETKLSNGRVKFPITIPLGEVVETPEEG